MHKAIALAALTLTLLSSTRAQTSEANPATLASLPPDSEAWVAMANTLARESLSSQPDTCLKYARLALDAARSQGLMLHAANSLRCLGEVYSSLGAYSLAADHLFQAADASQQAGDWRGLCETYNALGGLFYFTRQLEESIGYHQKALDLAQELRDDKLEGTTLGFIGHFYEKQLNYQLALEYQLKALKKLEQARDSVGLSTIYGHLGSISEDAGQYQEAFTYFWKAWQFSLLTGKDEERIIHLNNLGDVHRKQGQYAEAMKYTLEALELARRLGNSYQVKSSWRDLSKIHADMGNFSLAHAYLDSAYELHETLFDQASANQLGRLQGLYEREQTQRELELLKQDQHLTRLTVVFLTVGLLMLVVIAALIFRQQRLRNRQERVLHQAQQALTRQELENSQLHELQLQREVEAHSTQLSSHALSIVQKNNILKEIKTRLSHLKTQDKSVEKPLQELIQKIEEGFHFDEDWASFNNIFERVHPEFYRTLSERFPELTATEIRLCALIRLHLDPKDIASIMGISLDSLRVSRHRLRKSLGLSQGTNLVAFIMSL